MANNKAVQEHGEAPRSATASVKTPNGFYWLFSMRESTADELIKHIDQFEKIVLAKGWTPVEPRQQQGSFQKPKGPEKPCPKHPEQMMKENKNGKWYHTRGVYPNLEYCNGYGFPDEKGTPYPTQNSIPERDIQEEGF